MSQETKFWLMAIGGLLWLVLLVYLTIKLQLCLKIGSGNRWLLRLLFLSLMLLGWYHLSWWVFGFSETANQVEPEYIVS